MIRSAPDLSRSRRLRYLVFFLLYTMQGIPSGFALTATANLLIDRGLTEQAVANFAFIIGIPWTVKFLWGPLIDRFQGSRLGRRRRWVLIAQGCSLIATAPLLLVERPESQLLLLQSVFLVHSICAALQDASVDAMAISTTPESERGRTNALMRAGFQVGLGLGAAGLAVVLEHMGFRAAAIGQSLLLLGLTAATALFRERPGDALFPWSPRLVDVPNNTVNDPEPSEAVGSVGFVDDLPVGTDQTRDQPSNLTMMRLLVALVRGLFRLESILVFGTIAAGFAMLRAFERLFSNMMILQLGWDNAEVSQLTGLYGTLGALAVALGVGFISDRVGHLRMMLLSALTIASILLVFCLGSQVWSAPLVAPTALIVWKMLYPLLSASAIPLAMSLCRKPVEGSQFTAYTSMINLSEIGAIRLTGQARLSTTTPVIGAVMAIATLTIAGLVAVREAVQRDRDRSAKLKAGFPVEGYGRRSDPGDR